MASGISDEELRTEIMWVRDVIEQTRRTFLTANLASLIVLVALFNTYFSWMHNVRERYPETVSEVGKALARSEVSDLMVTSIPLLGLKIFAGDLGVLSAVGMLVLSAWLYYALRREQHGVGRLILQVGSLERQLGSQSKSRGILRKAPAVAVVRLKPEALENAERILWGLSTSFLFTTSPIDRAVGENVDQERYIEEGPGIAVGLKSALLYAPALVVALLLVVDVVTLFYPSILSSSAETRVSLWSTLAINGKANVALRFAFSGLFLVFGILPMLRRASYFAHWTQASYRGLAVAVTKESDDGLLWVDWPSDDVSQRSS